MLNNTPVQMEFDIYGNTKKMREYYNEGTNYKELYKKKFIVRTIIGKLASIFSNTVIKDSSEKETDLLKKLQNPNQNQSTEEFLKDFAINLFTSGYSMIWKKWSSFGNFKTLELIIIDTDTEITTVGKTTVKTEYNEIKETIKKEDIIFFYDSEKSKDDLTGVSRLKPFKAQIENIIDSKFAKNIQIENSGTTVVSPKSTAVANNLDEGLNAPVPVKAPEGGLKTQKEEMEDRLNSRGIANRIIVSNKGLDAKNLSAELNDVNFSDITEVDAIELYDLYSFAPELTPYGKNATFENKPAAENKLIEAEIITLSKSLARSLNQDFSNYGEIMLTYDHINSVATTKNKVVDVQKVVVEMYVSLFKEGLIDEKSVQEQLIINGIIKQ